MAMKGLIALTQEATRACGPGDLAALRLADHLVAPHLDTVGGITITATKLTFADIVIPFKADHFEEPPPLLSAELDGAATHGAVP